MPCSDARATGWQRHRASSFHQPKSYWQDAVADKKEKKKNKKDAQLVIRLDSELRNRFKDACHDLDTSAAREIRKYIKRFLKRYDRGEMDE